jgi:tetratricopeptide (TPR) repeat protein
MFVKKIWTLLVLLSAGYAYSQTTQQYAEIIDAGNEYMAKGDYENAASEYTRAIRLIGNQPEAYHARAMSYQALNESEKAIVDFTTVIKLSSNILEAYYGRGILYYETNRYQLSLSDLKKVLEFESAGTNSVYFKTSPGSEGVTEISSLAQMESEVLTYLGDICSQLSKYDSADYYFKQALELEPFDAEIHIARAGSYEQRGMIYQAISGYSDALKLDPENSIALYNMAVLARSIEPDEAIEEFTEVIQAAPGIAGAYEYRALAYFQKAEYDKAYNDYKKAIDLDASEPDRWYNLGLIEEKKGLLKEAYRSFSKALDLGGSKGVMYRNRANVLFKMRDYETAEAEYTLSITYDPSDPSTFFNRALARKNMGKDDEACADVNKAIELGMEQAKAYLSKICK